MHLGQIFAGAGARTVRVGLIGVGEFGTTFVLQARRIPGLAVAVLCEREPERAVAAYRAAGHAAADIARCDSAAAAARAIAAGRPAVLQDSALLADLPLDMIVEATGAPEAAAANAAMALAAGKHVALVSKEADSVVGPLLARKAHAAGLVCTPVDGDQPSLLIGLVAWARLLGFDVVAAGKASEYDFVCDAAMRHVTRLGETVAVADLAMLWHEPDVAARAAALPGLPRHTAPDLCEMTLVANATGLAPDVPEMHAPIARTVELPSLFRPRGDGGILGAAGAVDFFNCFRRHDEASFAGGVFAVVACPTAEAGKLLGGKGLPVSADGRHLLLHNPVHLLGMEAPVSVLSACRLGRSTAGDDVRPRIDLAARAVAPLKRGTRLDLGARHEIPGLQPIVLPARAADGDAPIPYYMAAGNVLAADVPAGATLSMHMIEAPADSALWRLRAEQDAAFFD